MTSKTFMLIIGTVLASGASEYQIRQPDTSPPVLELRAAYQEAGPSRVFVEGLGTAPGLYVDAAPLASDVHFQRVSAKTEGGRLVIDIVLAEPVAERVAGMTRSRVGGRIALLYKSRVLVAPEIRSELSGRMQLVLQVSDLPAGLAEEITAWTNSRWPTST